ncbi:alpha/beta hydrolase [Robertmurraya sp. DFI.2.37]|uniref:alpha/beta hydrolase n=1 Tax=Robertmurraya sp. DFI.2.37 TaxID=3031819 RepID=UPI0012482292|nr:alpha/beta hydrolase [Robertmurraya sp. DFI.2.37]MDF1506964.1 alpha/beta hydrolase [Robertmurraya sp. DFI.2.37]
MKTTVMFIHSAGPQGQNQGSTNLSAYLKKELEEDYNFYSPSMPIPENPKYVEWKKAFEQEGNHLSGEVILIGHSLGGSFLLKYLSEESMIKISGLFVVAAPYWGIDSDWQRSDFFLQSGFERHFGEIDNLFLYHSRGEDIVPFVHHAAYAKKLPHAHKRVLDGNQHLFSNGLTELVNDIRSLSSI